MKFFKSPLVQFLLLGVVIYLAYAFVAKQREVSTDFTVVITAREVEWMDANWKKRWMRAPTEAEREGFIKQYVRENLLYREALALGLEKEDPVIRRMLAQKIERMVQDLAMGVEPTDEELKAWFEAHADDYLDPERLTLTQIFFDPDKRGDDTLTDAEAVKLKLQVLEEAVAASKEMGDSFMLQSYFPARTQMEIAKVLGGGFAESVFKLSEGKWHGPVLSGYGVHLVYIQRREEPVLPEFAAVKDRVLEDWQTQKRIDLTEEYVDTLRGKYTVVVEGAE